MVFETSTAENQWEWHSRDIVEQGKAISPHFTVKI
jgi:hypothetical protein